MKVTIHGTEIVCTEYDNAHINAEIKDRDGNTVNLFFDSVDDLELLASELKIMSDSIHEESLKPGACQFCEGSGMGATIHSRCHICKGEGVAA